MSNSRTVWDSEYVQGQHTDILSQDNDDDNVDDEDNNDRGLEMWLTVRNSCPVSMKP